MAFCLRFNKKSKFRKFPPLSFCFSKNFQRIYSLFSLQFPLKYVVNWDLKVLAALWKIISAQWWFSWEAQGLLPWKSNILSVKPQQCPTATELTQAVLELCSHIPSMVWVWGLGGICFGFLNWPIKSCHSSLTSHTRFQHESTVFTVPLCVWNFGVVKSSTFFSLNCLMKCLEAFREKKKRW